MNLNQVKRQSRLCSKIIISSIWLLIIIFISCSTSIDKNNLAKNIPIENYLVDSILLPSDISENSFNSQITYTEKESITFLDEEKGRFYTYNLETKTYTDSLESMHSKINSFFCRNLDSVYISTEDNLLITIFNKIHNVHDLNKFLNQIETNLFAQTLNPIQLANDTLVLTVRTFLPENDTLPSRKDVSLYYDIFMRIQKDSIEYIGRNNPNTKNMIGQDYYTNLKRERLMISPSKIVYSYQYKDSLLIYNFNDKRLIYSKIYSPNFKPNKTYDNKMFGDADFTKEYLFSQTRFSFLHFDKNQNLVYQYLKHAGEYITKTGEKNAYYDLPFSLMIYDKNLKLKKELLMGSKKYWPLKTFITNDGLFIAGHKSIQKKEGKTMFYKFSITNENIDY